MAAPSLPPVSELLQQVQRETARCQQELDAVKSPAAEYDEQTAIIKSRIEQCWKKYDDRSLANPVEIQADIINHGRSLERLKFSYEAGLADAEAAYARQVGEVWEKYCHGLLDVLQPCLSRQAIQRLYESSKRSSRSGGVPGRESATASGGVSSPDGRKRRGSGALPVRKRPRAGHGAPDDSHREHPAANISGASPDISPTTNPRPPGEGSVEAPEIGKLYLTSWGKSNAWSVVLLLPLENLRSVGVPYSLADLGLADPVPECYEYSSRNEPPRLRPGYEIGGPMARERQYPVIYFDGREFPRKNAVGWVTASDLQIFDPNNASIFRLIEHRSQVRQYLKDQKTKLATPKASSGPSQRTAATTDEELDPWPESPVSRVAPSTSGERGTERVAAPAKSPEADHEETSGEDMSRINSHDAGDTNKEPLRSMSATSGDERVVSTQSSPIDTAQTERLSSTERAHASRSESLTTNQAASQCEQQATDRLSDGAAIPGTECIDLTGDDHQSSPGGSHSCETPSRQELEPDRLCTTQVLAQTEELDDLDLAHHVLREARHGALFRSPLDTNKRFRVLDLGTGTGIWAHELAEYKPKLHFRFGMYLTSQHRRYPHAVVQGVDFNRIQPLMIPPNVLPLMELDVESSWSAVDHEWDLVHIRTLLGSIRCWPSLYRISGLKDTLSMPRSTGSLDTTAGRKQKLR
ncbi:hypothetical protein O9K51_11275 [Purpureocillium lavendulum]|uniref:Uncharacterized protein n=1 Tax=Purpureocillium lavendulum TaxID=1247861 RepID=A0AB34FAC9_9HYPO|nr:hypothetical protein O9K51_11275 [Purpureocillium lavendulum]